MSRNVTTTYYKDKKGSFIIQINRAKYADRALEHATKHLHRNTYGAWLAVINDNETGELYAIITRDVNGRLTSMFIGDPMFPKCLTSLSDFDEIAALLDEDENRYKFYDPQLD